VSWFWFNELLVSMWLVVTATNAVLFLVAWELMSLTSFFLVIFEHERKDVLQAGWTYLVATHLGTACLIFCGQHFLQAIDLCLPLHAVFFEVAIKLMLRWVKPTGGNLIIQDISDNM